MFLIHNPNMTLCPHCQTENKAGARFCNECGSACTPTQPVPSVVTSPLEPILVAHIAPESSTASLTHERGPLASQQASAAPTATSQTGIEVPTPFFLIANQPTAPSIAPIWAEKPIDLEPFLARNPEIKPRHQAESPLLPVTCITPAKANGSLTRYRLLGALVALVIATIGCVVLFSKLRAPASAITHPIAKPAAVKAVEELPHPDLANGKGVATLPERLIIKPRAQASQTAAPQTKPITEAPHETKTIAAQPAIEPSPSKVPMTEAAPSALQEGLNCLQQNKYDCAINRARIASKHNPHDEEAKRLLERARQARQQALEAIDIE
jgi:hypothetical protein